MAFVAHFIGVALAVLLASYVVPGIVVEGLGVSISVAVLLGLLNVTVKPVLTLLTLPLSFMTLGLFSLVINAALLMLVSFLVPGFHVSGLFPAFFGSAVIAIVSWSLHKLI